MIRRSEIVSGYQTIERSECRAVLFDPLEGARQQHATSRSCGFVWSGVEHFAYVLNAVRHCPMPHRCDEAPFPGELVGGFLRVGHAAVPFGEALERAKATLR